MVNSDVQFIHRNQHGDRQMNYTELVKNAQSKVSRYTTNQCEYAIADIHETLKLHPIDSAYSVKLLCELDACRDRKMAIMKGK
jgi:hypothetical protein